MDYSYHVGLDISKMKVDFAILSPESELLLKGEFANNPEGIRKWLGDIYKEFGVWEGVLFCMEETGYYCYPLLKELEKCAGLDIWLESPFRLKRRTAHERGKDDDLDAIRIGTYSIDFQRYIRIWRPTSENMERLSLLVSHRDRLVSKLRDIRNGIGGQEGFVSEVIHTELKEINGRVISCLEDAIGDLEQRINELMNADIELSRQDEIIRSVPGFGKVISSKLILVTRGFSRLDDARKLACFCGVAPFPYRSGSSIRGRDRVSVIADKEMKRMLYLAAMVTIRKGGIMYDYFHRKVAEGKHKMSVINAIKNKLLHIVLACVKNNTMYQKNYNG